MSEKNYRLPAVAWLKVTDYMHGWLQKELAGGVRIGDKRVVCIQHLPGARDALRMETGNDVTGRETSWSPTNGGENTMSATRRNCIVAGLELDAPTVERLYGITREDLSSYVPIECPKICLTKDGVLRPWSNDTCFGQRQATALQRLLRDTFWQGVADFAQDYAREHEGEKYAQVDMIEDFCRSCDTPDVFVEAMRREWQRRVKRAKG